MTGSAEARRKAAHAASFRELYDAHFPLVWRALRRLGVPSSDMMDLTQKVFTVTFTSLSQFEGRSSIATWLYGICSRVAAAHRRSSATRHEIPTDPATLAGSPVVATAAPSDVALTHHSEAERILAKLSEGQRAVFVLYEVDELSGPEIASLLGISLGTVRSRLRHARAVFRRETQRFAQQHDSAMNRR
jgi:RNA polymerase sigma-70 factor (ECF subfamily)